MATVNGLSKARMEAIENASIVEGEVDENGDLILKNFGEETFNAGHVVGPVGPTGSIVLWPAMSPPTGWLISDGSAVSRDTYADLFNIIGTAYGSGDGSTTFNLPNLKGRVPVGYDSAQTEFNEIGKTGGEKTHILTVAEMPSHTHTQNSHNHTQNSHNHTQNSHNHTQNSHTHGAAGSGYMFMMANGNVAVNGTSRTTAAAGGTWGYVYTISSENVNIIENNNTLGTTATNQGTTATNQGTTATNQATTATNQNTGGGGAHNNLQPFITLNYIIKT